MVADDITVLAVPSGEAAESLASGALDWLLGSARSTRAGLTWAATVPGAEANFSLYHGAAGIVLALLEAQRHFGDDRYGDAAMRGAAAIAAAADHEEDCSLYFGLAGPAVALHAVHVQLGDSAAGGAARRRSGPGAVSFRRAALGRDVRVARRQRRHRAGSTARRRSRAGRPRRGAVPPHR